MVPFLRRLWRALVSFIIKLHPKHKKPPVPPVVNPTPPSPPSPATLEMAWVRQSSGLNDTQAAQIVEALNLQVAHLQAKWPNVTTDQVRHVYVGTDPSAVPASAWPSYWLPTSDIANALGYHDVDPSGRPYTRVFTEPVLRNGGSVLTGELSIAAVSSHEGCEEAIDAPTTLVWTDPRTGWTYAAEVSDPVEGDSYSVELATGLAVSVSDFVCPEWADLSASGGYDYMGLLSAPFEVRSTGYVIVDKHDGHGMQPVFAEHYPAWKLDSKRHPASRTQRRLRAAQAA